MGAGRDDDALTWGGDNDPTLDVGAPPPSADESSEATPAAAEGQLANRTAADGQLGNAALAHAAHVEPVTVEPVTVEPVEPVTTVTDAAAPVESASAAPTPAEPLPEGWNAVGKGSDAIPTGKEDAEATASDIPSDDKPAPLGNAALIALGLLGGVYLLYAIGWLIGGLRLSDTAQYLVSPVVFQVALWLAVLAPAIWFGTVYVVTGKSKAWVRFAWLIGGVALLVPWPFIMIGAIGQ